MSDQAMLNIGDLAKPATMLIEKISNAIGIIYEPRHIKKIAKAEADADIIKFEAKERVKELALRTSDRMLQEEMRRQENIESIIEKAIHKLSSDAKAENIEDDWLTDFFSRSRIISDENMQEVWAKILAGEANSPNTYSKRTLNLLSILEKSEADLFAKLCNLHWQIQSQILPVIFNIENEVYKKHNINFSTLSHLDSIGLINFNNLSEFELNSIKHPFVSFYGDNRYLFKLPEGVSKINLGRVMFTKTGKELSYICNRKLDNDYLQYCIQEWQKQNIIITRF